MYSNHQRRQDKHWALCLILLNTWPVNLTHWGRDKMAATFADDTFKCKVANENLLISMKISLKFVRKGLIKNMPALV